MTDFMASADSAYLSASALVSSSWVRWAVSQSRTTSFLDRVFSALHSHQDLAARQSTNAFARADARSTFAQSFGDLPRTAAEKTSVTPRAINCKTARSSGGKLCQVR